MDIRRKALLFIGAAGIVTSLLLGGVLLWGLDMAEQLMQKHTDSIGTSVKDEAENFAREETRKRLEGSLQLQASYINAIMAKMEGDVFILAHKMTQLMKDDSLPYHHVYDPRKETVTSGQIYFLLGATDEAYLPKVQQVAAIEDTMRNLMRSYNGYPLRLYVGARDGWSLRMDFLADENAPVTLPQGALTDTYDVRERNWYKAGVEAWKNGAPSYPPLYVSLRNEPMLGCVMAFADEQGFAGVVGMSAVPSVIQGEILPEMSLEGKISFVLNEQGQIIFSSLMEGILMPGDPKRDLRQEADTALADVAKAMTAGQSGSCILQVEGKDYCLVYAPVGNKGWSIGQLEELSEIQEPAHDIGRQVAEEMQDVQEVVKPLFPKLRWLMAVSFVLLLFMLVGVSWYWAEKFSRPIRQLAEGVSGVAEGRFSERLELHTGDEVETLADAFNEMTGSLQAHMDDLAAVTGEKAKVAAGLEVAASIQQSLLPKDFPCGRNFSLYGNMEPAKEVGGDFYDFYFLDESRLALVIADVSDKGIPAAMFMVVARTLLKNSLLSTGDLSAAFRDTNDKLAEENEEDLFVTVFAAVLDTVTGELSYVSAGHCPPLIKGAAGVRELPKGRSPMLGIRAGLDFGVQVTRLAEGELLFLYTDGVTDAMDEQGGMFGRERLESFLAEAAADTEPQALLTDLQAGIRRYTGGAEQYDDLTMLALRWEKIKK